ncbi:MAG TPA: hypothetical protein VH482_20255, partial [Thermomicrobiales bacterium]
MTRAGQSSDAAVGAAASVAPPRFNPYRPEFRRDPYPTYHRFRDADPVNWGDAPGLGSEGCWYLFRYADVLGLLRDPRVG